jgi:hypothetical protein
MRISLKTIMENLPPEQRAIVEKRSTELMAEEMTLHHPLFYYIMVLNDRYPELHGELWYG